MSKELAVRDVIASVEKDWNAVENLRLSFAKEMGFALQIVEGNAQLKALSAQNPDDLKRAIYNVALTGLSLNPVLKQAYLMPRKGKLIFEPSYMGLTEILVQAGTIVQMESSVVCENDYIEIELGDVQRITHKINITQKRGEIVGAYAIATLPSGQKHHEILTREELESLKLRSPSKTAWESDFSEMCRKSAIRRIFKHLPKTALSENAINAFAVFDENNKLNHSIEPVNTVTGEIRAARLEAANVQETPEPESATEALIRKSKAKIATLKTLAEFNKSFEGICKIQDIHVQEILVNEIQRVAETKGFIFDADSDGFYEQKDEVIQPAPESPATAADGDLF